MKLTLEQYNELKNSGLKSHYYSNDLSPFAEACFNYNSYDDIKNYKTDDPDEGDMKGWDLDEEGWRDAQEECLQLAMYWYEDETE